MSMTSLPSTAKPSSAPRLVVEPPILASDILREEIAPRTPGRTVVRYWLAAFAAACALSAAAAHLGIGPHSTNVFEGTIVAGAVAAIGAAVPVPYAARAVVAALAGLVLLGLGALDRGPLAPIGHEGALSAFATVLLSVLLPAALLFRARFRAFKTARVVLGLALAASAPAVIFAVVGTLQADAPVALRIVDGFVVAATLTGFFGFLGAETSAGCGRFAALVLAATSTETAMRALSPTLPGSGDYGPWGYPVAAVGMLASATIAAFGLFQLLAATLGASARQVDVHQVAAKPAPSGENE